MEHSSVPERIERFEQFYLGTYYPLHRFHAARGIAPGPLLADDLDP